MKNIMNFGKSFSNYDLTYKIIKIQKMCINYSKKPKEIDRVYKYRRYDNEQVKDFNEFQKNLKESRRKITEEYWEENSQIEKNYLKGLEIKQLKEKDDLRKRNLRWIIKQSWICYKDILKRKDLHQKYYAKEKVWNMAEKEMNIEKQALLNILDKQAENWLTPDTMDEKMHHILDEILPPTIISHKDYYNKLSKYALLIDSGKLEEAEKLKGSDEHMEAKNKLLFPIYQNIRKIIERLSVDSNSYYSILKKYETYKNILITKFGTIEKGEGLIEFIDLKKRVKMMLDIIDEQYSKPSKKLSLIEIQIQGILNLIISWNKYVEILYMTDEDIFKILNNSPFQDKEFEKYEKNNEENWFDEKNTETYLTSHKKSYLDSINDSTSNFNFNF